MDLANRNLDVSWHSDKYFAKAQKYWATATALERHSEQFWLNVSFFCEFFVRGAVVQTNPALNAWMDEDSLLYAAGFPTVKNQRTIEIATLLGRLTRIYPEITEDNLSKVKLLIGARNAELHGDGDHLASLLGSEIMPGLYSFVVKLAELSQRNLDDILGNEDAAQARATAQASAKDRRNRVKGLITVHRERFYTLDEDEQKRSREDNKPKFVSAVTKSGHHIKVHKCPACSELGLLVGAPIGKSNPILRDEEIVQELRVQPESFNCKCCSLEIKGLDELIAANFPREFVSLDSMDPVEFFSIDPMEYVDVDEIIREHGRDMYEYDDE